MSDPVNVADFADTPTLGLATLLEIFDGDLDAVDELVNVALASVDIDLERIARSIAANDRVTLIEAAHKLKGTCGSIRSTRALEISAAIERAAKAGTAPIAPELLPALRSAIEELHAEVATTRAQRTVSAQP